MTTQEEKQELKRRALEKYRIATRPAMEDYCRKMQEIEKMK